VKCATCGKGLRRQTIREEKGPTIRHYCSIDCLREALDRREGNRDEEAPAIPPSDAPRRAVLRRPVS
jgi:hypothetical protein